MKEMTELRALYLNTLAALVASQNLDAVIQNTGEGVGRLWCVRNGTTLPEFVVAFHFKLDGVTFGITHRRGGSNAELLKEVAYAEGLEGFMAELVRFLNEGKLAAPRAGGFRAKA